jgi:penicillin-binding protein 2
MFKKNTRPKYKDIDPDEIFLDSKNLPDFNLDQFEGRIEKPISRGAVFSIFGFFLIFIFLFAYKVYGFQIISGDFYKSKSETNRLDRKIIFANRGLILDRNNKNLVWNDFNKNNPDFSLRVYATSTGLSNIIGYVKYPAKDSSGNYYEYSYVPKAGLENLYNSILSGKNGLEMSEVDVYGKVLSNNLLEKPVDGENLNLTVDFALQKAMYGSMEKYSKIAGYRGGAGGIIDIENGELLSVVSFPEFDSNVVSLGLDKEKIEKLLTDKNNPFLNRFTNGLYTPGSIIKPFVAIGVLDRKIIDPKQNILSNGELVVPNPYNPDKPSVFKDWKVHGYVDLEEAIAVSSDVYFFQVGGGFENQKGLGIGQIEKYLRLFGFGQKVGVDFSGEQKGVIANPEWKKSLFKGEDWRLGDTYNTVIGQYGTQITPLQALVAVASIANNGSIIKPKIIYDKSNIEIVRKIEVDKSYFDIVKSGMRKTVTEGTAKSLYFAELPISAKTGTAELGVNKSLVNSWVIGFFPSDKPKYAFALVMEKGKANNQIGATLVMKDVFEWMINNKFIVSNF